MGLFDRIYHQGHGDPGADVGAEPEPAAEEPTDRRVVTPIRPSVVRRAPPPEKKGASAFAWGILGVVGLFGAGYLANAWGGRRPAAPKAEEEEE